MQHGIFGTGGYRWGRFLSARDVAVEPALPTAWLTNQVKHVRGNEIMTRYAAAFALFGATAYFVLSLFREDSLEEVLSTAILWGLGFAVLGAALFRAAQALLGEHSELVIEVHDEISSSEDLERGPAPPGPVPTDDGVLH